MPVGGTGSVAFQVCQPKIIQHMKCESGLPFCHTCWEEPHFYKLPVGRLGVRTLAVVYSQLMHAAHVHKHNHVPALQLWRPIPYSPSRPLCLGGSLSDSHPLSESSGDNSTSDTKSSCVLLASLLSASTSCQLCPAPLPSR